MSGSVSHTSPWNEHGAGRGAAPPPLLQTGSWNGTKRPLWQRLPGAAPRPGGDQPVAAAVASPRFCILGAGAIGGTLAALLARAGAKVSLVARGETLSALKRDGLSLISNGEMLQVRVQVTDNPSELGMQDYVIVAVKAPSLPDIAPRIGPLLGPTTVVVTAMNGVPWWFFLHSEGALAGRGLQAVDPEGAIGRAVPPRRVIGCVSYVSACVDAPGVIRHSVGHRLLVGEPDRRSTPRLRILAGWLSRAGFDCEASSDIRRDVWLKLWGNLSLNPISLLTTATSDRIFDDPLARRLCASMMEEAAQIGAAIGLQASPPVETMIETFQELGPFKTSMLQDVEHNKPVEIDALLTVTHDIGLLVGVPTPFIDSVLGLARLRASSLGLFDAAAELSRTPASRKSPVSPSLSSPAP